MEDTLVFIDAGYSDKIARSLLPNAKHRVRYVDFCDRLAKEQGLRCRKIYYYNAPPYQDVHPTAEQRKRKAGYDRFVSAVRREHRNFVVREGRLQLVYTVGKDGRPAQKYNQKGVDTWLTIDLLEEPLKEKVKRIILVAADSDFVPVITRIRSRGIRVILYYYTSHSGQPKTVISKHLIDACGKGNAFLLNRGHFEETTAPPMRAREAHGRHAGRGPRKKAAPARQRRRSA